MFTCIECEFPFDDGDVDERICNDCMESEDEG